MLRRLSVHVLIVLSISAAAVAQNSRSAVSLTGSDANACTVAAPCRSFAIAMAQTNPGGEIVALDSAGYGPFNVDRSVTVMAAPGVYAGITAGAATDGVSVNALFDSNVVLRNLSLNGAPGVAGLRINSAADVHVESCVINRFLQQGIYLGEYGRLFVVDTIVRLCGTGLEANTGSASLNGYETSVLTAGRAYVNADRCRFEQNAGYGVLGGPGSTIIARHSISTGNTYGFAVNGGISTADMFLESCLVSLSSSLGITAASGTIRVARTAIIYNNTGVGGDPATASVQSFGNNRLAGNVTNGAFLSVIALQ